MNKYQEVMNQIKSDILSGRYKAGSKLPSIRELAESFQCSKATAIRAYAELEKQHIIYSKPQSGYYMVEVPDTLGNNTYKVAAPSEAIDFASASPDPEVLPYRDFQHCLNQAIELYKDSLFSYSDPQGLLGARKALCEHFKDHQIFTPIDNIFITSGSQQILSILAAMPFPNGKTSVLVEQPVYNGITKALELSGTTTIGIERSFDGMDMEKLERIFATNSIKFFYTIPRFHNPTGGSHSLEQKKHIVRLAQKYDVYILEDDYLADLDLSSKNDPMFSFDTGAHTIYAKSFSKVLLPGLRLGAAVLPKLLANKFREYKRAADISTSILSQGALELYIKSGMFKAHAGRIREFYPKRMQVLKKALDSAKLEKVEYKIPPTGFFANLEFPDSFDVEPLVRKLKNYNISVLNVRTLFMDSFARGNMIRLSICRADEENIRNGVAILGREYRELMRLGKHGISFPSEQENVFLL